MNLPEFIHFILMLMVFMSKGNFSEYLHLADRDDFSIGGFLSL